LQILDIREPYDNDIYEKRILFQLSSSFIEDISKLFFCLSDNMLMKFNFLFSQLSEAITMQEGKYQTYKIRTYFLDIISNIERMYYSTHFYQNNIPSAPVEIPNVLSQIIEYVNKNISYEHSLKSIYEKFYINKNQIQYLFKKYYNITFYEYLMKSRYKEACDYLRFTDLDCEQIAFRIGISSGQNFSRFFKTMCGISPNTYRKKLSGSLFVDNINLISEPYNFEFAKNVENTSQSKEVMFQYC